MQYLEMAQQSESNQVSGKRILVGVSIKNIWVHILGVAL